MSESAKYEKERQAEYEKKRQAEMQSLKGLVYKKVVSPHELGWVLKANELLEQGIHPLSLGIAAYVKI
ncbi:MAG: hypothetical protein WCL23_02070 [Candidatus Moraniibacteriota bacterium]